MKMTIKTFYIFALIVIINASCSPSISDRTGPLNEADLKIQVDTFQIHKRVAIELETESYFDFSDCQLMIFVNSQDVVFNGNYARLLSSKIPLPAPNEYSENQSGYLIGITVYDLENKKEYRWSADHSFFLNDKKKNKIKLLYTGIPGESITLNVEQID